MRELTGLLTQYWTGEDMVAGVRDIRCERGEFWFVTELVEGEEPKDNAEVRDVLLTLRRRFAAAGLATWQIDPENPHAHTNFIRTPDGKLKLIDLESTLIPLVQPLAMLPRMFRMGRVPTFDDVDYDQLRRYVDEERSEIRQSLGDDALERLDAAIATAEACAATWKGAEPNLWGRAAHRVWHWIAWERRTGPIRRRLGQSEDLALRFVMKPLDRWVDEGWITAEGADGIRESLQSDSARKVMRFLGMHVVISTLLFLPPGSRSALRFGTTVALRTRDKFRYHQGEISRAEYDESRQIHTWLVAFAGLVPGFGAGAYLLSPQMRRDGKLISLAVNTWDNTADGIAIITVLVNGADTALQIQVPAGSQVVQIITTDVSVQAGDLVVIESDGSFPNGTVRFQATFEYQAD